MQHLSNRKGQAMIESLFALPLVVAVCISFLSLLICLYLQLIADWLFYEKYLLCYAEQNAERTCRLHLQKSLQQLHPKIEILKLKVKLKKATRKSLRYEGQWKLKFYFYSWKGEDSVYIPR